MAGSDPHWIDRFLDDVAGVAPAAEPAPPRPPEAPGAASDADLIGAGALIGPEPAEVLAKLAAAFGIEPTPAPLEAPALWT